MVVESGKVETFRHLNSFQGSWFVLASESALRLARAARRFASALCLCSSVISIVEKSFLGFQNFQMQTAVVMVGTFRERKLE